MTIKFDLRPEQFRVEEATSFSPLRVMVLSLVAVFFVFSVAFLGLGLFKLHALRAQQAEYIPRVRALNRQAKELKQELSRLKEAVAEREETLEMVKGELPSLEFFGAVEGSLPGTVWLRKVSLSSGKASLSGYAFSEGDVVVFSNALNESSVVKGVGMPDTNSSSWHGKRVVQFSLSCTLASFVEAAEGAAEGGDERGR
ncbi:MAG: PilN domain-containing protein [Synergistales bacterium]|nr:PilN domain-containing protein [Synergistales bacterium]